MKIPNALKSDSLNAQIMSQVAIFNSVCIFSHGMHALWVVRGCNSQRMF